MNFLIEKGAGIALLTGSLLLLSTMVLHPEGGNLQHLLKVVRITVISHSMAILAVPFFLVGFWGLTKRMGVNHFLPQLSFALMITGLVSGLIAATINGLAIPIFIQSYDEATIEIAALIKPILRNNLALNQAFDYIFLSATSLSIIFWSVAILSIKKMPLWIGYFGLLLSLTALTLLISGFVFVNLHGFRLFVFSNAVWISIIGIALIRSNQVEKSAVFTGLK